MRILAIITTFAVLACLFVALRLWTRCTLVKSPGYDDLLIFCALICSITFYAFIIVEQHYGLGIRRGKLSEDVIQGQMHYLWLSIPFYNLSLILAKLSILVLFTRIFRLRKFLICTYTTMAFLIIAGLWMVLSGFLFCIPVHDFWNVNYKLHAAHCLPEGPVWYANAAMQIFSDVVILILPMPLLSKLHLPWRQKIGIMLVFGVGVFVIATSSARLYELTKMIGSHDFTKTNSEAALWSSLEANVSIICACLAPLHPLLSRIFSFCFRPQPLHSSRATKTHSTTGTATHLTSSRKHSVYDHTLPDGSIFYNDFFYAGPGAYTASISRTNTNEDEMHRDGGEEDGIRVVRELRMVSDAVPLPGSPGLVADWTRDRDFEMEMGSGMGGRKGSTAGVNRTRNASIEWDLGDWEFPDYKERMNAPI